MHQTCLWQRYRTESKVIFWAFAAYRSGLLCPRRVVYESTHSLTYLLSTGSLHSRLLGNSFIQMESVWTTLISTWPWTRLLRVRFARAYQHLTWLTHTAQIVEYAQKHPTITIPVSSLIKEASPLPPLINFLHLFPYEDLTSEVASLSRSSSISSAV